jgi:hypothetical protein
VFNKDVHTHLEFPKNIDTMMDTLAGYLGMEIFSLVYPEHSGAEMT